MKLEAVDKRNPILVRVVTVVEVEPFRFKIHFDGWSDIYDYWVDDDCCDIHPQGWCASTGHPLTPPLCELDLPGPVWAHTRLVCIKYWKLHCGTHCHNTHRTLGKRHAVVCIAHASCKDSRRLYAVAAHLCGDGFLETDEHCSVMGDLTMKLFVAGLSCSVSESYKTSLHGFVMVWKFVMSDVKKSKYPDCSCFPVQLNAPGGHTMSLTVASCDTFLSAPEDLAASPSQGGCPTIGCSGVGHIKGAKFAGHHRWDNRPSNQLSWRVSRWCFWWSWPLSHWWRVSCHYYQPCHNIWQRAWSSETIACLEQQALSSGRGHPVGL